MVLYKLIDFPTRNNNILDLILINNPLLISHSIASNSFEYNNHISDHVYIILKLVLLITNSLTNNICSEERLNYYKADIFNIKLLLNSVDLIYVISKYDNYCQSLSSFIDIVHNIIRQNTPTLKIKNYKYPSFIKKQLNVYPKLHRQIIDSNTHNIWRIKLQTYYYLQHCYYLRKYYQIIFYIF